MYVDKAESNTETVTTVSKVWTDVGTIVE